MIYHSNWKIQPLVQTREQNKVKTYCTQRWDQRKRYQGTYNHNHVSEIVFHDMKVNNSCLGKIGNRENNFVLTRRVCKGCQYKKVHTFYGLLFFIQVTAWFVTCDSKRRCKRNLHHIFLKISVHLTVIQLV